MGERRGRKKGVKNRGETLDQEGHNQWKAIDECASSYYKYGCALLYKAQEEAEPLGNFPKGPPTSVEKAKTSSCTEESGSSSKACVDNSEETPIGKEAPDGEGLGDEDNTNDEVDDESGDDDEDTAEADEDESDLDLAWKMLDVARAIVEKNSENTMEKVNILAALAEVSMERDAMPYCEKAISLCKSRLQRLKENTTSLTTPAEAVGSSVSGSEKSDNLTAEDARPSSNFVEEIELFSSILTELEKKLEDLQQTLMNPRSVVSEVMKLIASKQAYDEKNAPSASRASSLNSSQMGATNGGFDSPTIATAASNGGVMDLGVVGRGIKRATIRPIDAEPSQKKPMLDKSTES
ncbi:Nuclear autoantigenic sperm protein (Histone-binding) [Musa troglodytarum]|uniref:Nuclear autoantigenic sperm protein (Histone-binding) n=1 Tax=Musa troglodytarum TaxID=320322 RepID=A0A9E7HZ63_9LILI|nr:Nuclear autoantigenic sperm protein (Histone-binding) [Musa troglodytarum]